VKVRDSLGQLGSSFLVNFARDFDFGIKLEDRLVFGRSAESSRSLDRLGRLGPLQELIGDGVGLIPCANPFTFQIGDFGIGSGNQVERLKDLEQVIKQGLEWLETKLVQSVLVGQLCTY
jgi:hypothetical protein